MTEFPKKLFVRLVGVGAEPDEMWFQADENSANLADDSNLDIDVAVYELVSTGKLVTKIELVEDNKTGA